MASSTSRSVRRGRTAAGRRRRALVLRQRAGLPAEHRDAGVAPRREQVARAAVRGGRRPAAIAATWAARSSSAPFPSGSGCAGPTATPSCIPRRRTRPTRWEPPWPAAGRGGPPRRICRLALDTIGRRRRPCARPVGQQPGQPDRRPRRPGGRAEWGRPSASRCSATSATASSPGTVRAAPSWSTAQLVWSPCTRSRSGPTWPAVGSASTPATVSSCATSRKCASTSA